MGNLHVPISIIFESDILAFDIFTSGYLFLAGFHLFASDRPVQLSQWPLCVSLDVALATQVLSGCLT